MIDFLVCLVGDQPGPTLISTANLPGLRKVYLVHSDKTQHVAGRLQKSLEQLLPGITVETRTVDAFDIAAVQARCLEALEAVNRNAMVDITGGTKIMALGAYLAATQAGVPSVYVDTGQRCLREIGNISDGCSNLSFLAEVPLNILMLSHGCRITSQNVSSPDKRERKIAYYFAHHMEAWEQWRQAMEHIKRAGIPQAQVTIEPLSGPIVDFLDLASSVGVLRDYQKVGNRALFSFSSRAIRHWLMSGHWLELYTYLEVDRVGFNQVLRNVKLELESPGGQVSKGEVDVLISHQGRLGFISCKAGHSEGKEALEELFTLAGVAGGIFAHRILVTLAPDPDGAIKRRAELLNLNIISRESILELANQVAKITGV